MCSKLTKSTKRRVQKLDGMGGASIFRVMEADPNLSVVLETLTNSGQEQIMGQVYLPEIVDGDKRILIVNEHPCPTPWHAFPGENPR